MGVNTSFCYKQGNSFLHKCPAWIKILFIPVISILVFKLPAPVSAGLFAAQVILSFCLHFTLKEQLYDLRAVLYYAVILFFIKLAGAIFFKSYDFLPSLIMLLKLLCVMQTASIVFKTSTSLQLREAFGKNPVSQALALFICFIPLVSKNWELTKRAWIARGGKKSLRMLVVLLPVLFSVGMKQAYNSARALSIRQG